MMTLTLQDDEHYIIFQQDGTLPYHAFYVHRYLGEHFSRHWIRRRGSVKWSLRSPDLSSLDFFLSHTAQPIPLEDLRQRIVDEY